MTVTNPYLPASSQFPIVQPEKSYYLSNFSPDGEGSYTLSLPNSEKIRPGIKVKFYSANHVLLGLGFVTHVKSPVIYCKPFSALSITPHLVEFVRGWSLNSGESVRLHDPTIFVSSSQTSILSAYCSFPGTHEPGLIRWSLFYLQTEEDEETTYYRVIDGNDASVAGLCFFEHSGLWRAGTYELRAERYSSQSSILLSSDTQNWTLESPSNRLSCGGYSDPLPLLIL